MEQGHQTVKPNVLESTQVKQANVVAQLCVGIASNFSAIYNFTNIDYAIKQMEKREQVPGWLSSAASSASLAGAVLGMVILGWLGDRLGRAKSMQLTLLMVVLGAGGSAVLSLGEMATRSYLLTVWRCPNMTAAVLMHADYQLFRFLLGIGIGGIFPLSAVSTAEAGKIGESMGDRNRRTAFNMAGVYGAMLVVPLLTISITLIVDNPSIAWRIILGFGALPTVLVMVRTAFLEDSPEFDSSHDPQKNESALRALTPANVRRLAGAAGGWFCLDWIWYSINISMPSIVQQVFDTDSDKLTALYTCLFLLLSIPAFVMTIRLLHPTRLGLRNTQLVGFVAAALSFGVLAAVFGGARQTTWALGLAFGFMIFSLSLGTMVTTYVLPQAMFAPQDRAFLNGISAGLAKIGGAVGVAAYKGLSSWSTTVAMVQCALIAALGCVITILFVAQDKHIEELNDSNNQLIKKGIRHDE